MKKILLVLFLGLSFVPAGTLETMEARAMLDADKGASLEYLEREYSEALIYLDEREEYTFEFPTSVGECLFSLDIDSIRFSTTEDFIRIPEIVGIPLDEHSFLVSIFVEKDYTAGLSVVFEYILQKKIEDTIYTYVKKKSILLSGLTTETELIEIPTECSPEPTNFLTTNEKESKWKRYFQHYL